MKTLSPLEKPGANKDIIPHSFSMWLNRMGFKPSAVEESLVRMQNLINESYKTKQFRLSDFLDALVSLESSVKLILEANEYLDGGE